MTRWAGAVLTGGASRRMGRAKALLEHEGRPLATRVATLLTGVGATHVAAIGGPPSWGAPLGLPIVPDRWPGAGPLGGILTALTWSPEPLVLVVACDLPWLTADALADLVANPPDDGAVATFVTTGRRELQAALWSVDRARAPLQQTFDAGERSIHRALETLVVREVAITDAGAWRDVDRPEDLLDRSGS